MLGVNEGWQWHKWQWCIHPFHTNIQTKHTRDQSENKTINRMSVCGNLYLIIISVKLKINQTTTGICIASVQALHRIAIPNGRGWSLFDKFKSFNEFVLFGWLLLKINCIRKWWLWFYSRGNHSSINKIKTRTIITQIFHRLNWRFTMQKITVDIAW